MATTKKKRKKKKKTGKKKGKKIGRNFAEGEKVERKAKMSK